MALTITTRNSKPSWPKSRPAPAGTVVTFSSAATYLDCAIVSESHSVAATTSTSGSCAARLRSTLSIMALAQLAADAFAQFSKGRHPAGLNDGDCFAYALAKSLGAALLFKGLDFSRTDSPVA